MSTNLYMGIKIHKRQRAFCMVFSWIVMIGNHRINTWTQRQSFLNFHFFNTKSHLWNTGTGKLKVWLNVKHLIVIRCESEGYLYYTSCPGTLNGTYGTSGWRACMQKHRYTFLSEKTMKSNLLIKWWQKLTANQIWSRNVSILATVD